MTTTVFLVRHAAHDRVDRILCGRMPGVSLSQAGRKQAARLADRLAREPIATIHTSPLDRARETAAPLAVRLGLPAEVVEDLLEIDLGAWSGRSFDELETDPLWAAWNKARAMTRAPGGETMLEAQWRVVRHIERLRARYPERGVVLVSHGDVIKAALAYHLGLPLDAYGRFEISPASISTLVVGDWGAKVLSLNEVAA